MNERGQFFLVATFIIIGVLLGLTTIVNYVNVKESKEYFYDLAKEVGDENKELMDYSAYSEENVLDLTSDFLFNYSDYIGSDQFISVYGNSSDLYGMHFKEESLGVVGIDTGGEWVTVPVQRKTGKEANVSLQGEEIKVIIDNSTHTFEMKKGYNFFYIVIKEDEDEVLVAEG